MNKCSFFLAEPDRLQKFEIRLGSSDQAQTNPLCWKQDSAVLAGSKTFKCQSGPAVGRYLSVEKDGTGLDKSRYILTLCEVVVIGGIFYVILFGRGIVLRNGELYQINHHKYIGYVKRIL